ncbi:hypothetical protein I307_02284 [Cryptococcus deuterogattii 99/473]|uniref:Uncharacterized protein n=1 Tax=Cryptococcus deuterogattii Ram5 TaxID=1296110 RepID=A0A0D0V2M9_9TREE|nr:hypothetical protein I313_03505 [Cryptococcus deuterogattii Ram5]KIS00988.1 hypothetical protein L804_00857 [Cryptococcus deuterogattii 2001/935-1]KIY58485.1 hypothetical protein I307_02284 [Cryptococcus deuterogattii 99/473]
MRLRNVECESVDELVKAKARREADGLSPEISNSSPKNQFPAFARQGSSAHYVCFSYLLELLPPVYAASGSVLAPLYVVRSALFECTFQTTRRQRFAGHPTEMRTFVVSGDFEKLQEVNYGALVRILPSPASLNKLSGIISDLIALHIGKDKPLAILLLTSYINVRDEDRGFYEFIEQKKGGSIGSLPKLFTITMRRLRPVLDFYIAFATPDELSIFEKGT